MSKIDIPFKALIVPIGHTNVTYVFTDKNQKYDLRGKALEIKDLILTGQVYGQYFLHVFCESEIIK